MINNDKHNKLIFSESDIIREIFVEPKLFFDHIQAEDFNFLNFKHIVEMKIPFSKNCSVEKYSYEKQILNLLFSRRYRKGKVNEELKLSIYKKLSYLINHKAPLHFILPSFPFKISNIEKCNRLLPDISEVSSLCYLDNMMKEISNIYPPGAKLTILSDGESLRNIFDIPHHNCILYQNNIQAFIKKLELNNIELVDLNQLLDAQSPNFSEIINEKIFEKRSRNDENIKRIAKTLFNNISTERAIFDMILLLRNKKKIDINDFIKKRLIKAKDGALFYYLFWKKIEEDNIINDAFPNSIRLSPHNYKNQRLTINLMYMKQQTILPWMGIGVIRNTNKKSMDIVTNKYVRDVWGNDNYMPIYIKNEETPFAYLETL